MQNTCFYISKQKHCEDIHNKTGSEPATRAARSASIRCPVRSKPKALQPAKVQPKRIRNWKFMNIYDILRHLHGLDFIFTNFSCQSDSTAWRRVKKSTFPCTLSKSATTRATVVLPVPGFPLPMIGEHTFRWSLTSTKKSSLGTPCAKLDFHLVKGGTIPKNIVEKTHRRKHLALPRCLVFPSPFLSYAAPSGVWRKVILRTSCNEKIFEGLMILRNQRKMHSQWHLDSTLFHRFQTNDAIQAFECSLFIAAGP